jgi:hypothetical protein
MKRTKNPPWRVEHPETQAARVVKKFGGPRRLSQILSSLGVEDAKRNFTSIYRWMWKKGDNLGTGGHIPHNAMPYIILAAHENNIELTQEDIFPFDINTLKRGSI